MKTRITGPPQRAQSVMNWFVEDAQTCAEQRGEKQKSLTFALWRGESLRYQ